jgi:ATP-dependent Zn protease
MEDPTLLTVLIGWFPMLLLIGVFIYFTRTLMSRTRSISGLTSVQYMEELLKETRRHNEQLERLLASTNERLSDIEHHRQL